MWFVLAFSIGFTLSAVWARYIHYVAIGHKLRATVTDVVLLLLTFAQYQLWAFLNNDWKVFACIILGTAPGTYLFTKRK